MDLLKIDRLRVVAVALRDAAKDKLLAPRFSMNTYGFPADEIDSDEKLLGGAEPCGTPACALGHFAVRDDLQPFLKLDRLGNLVYARKSKGRSLSADFSDARVKRYFGITCTESEDLFDSFGCNNATTPGYAALFIERFCNKKEKALGST